MECSLVGEYRLIFVGSITCCFFLALDVHTVLRLLADIFSYIRQTTDDAAKITGYFKTLNSVGIVHVLGIYYVFWLPTITHFNFETYDSTHSTSTFTSQHYARYDSMTFVTPLRVRSLTTINGIT